MSFWNTPEEHAERMRAHLNELEKRLAEIESLKDQPIKDFPEAWKRALGLSRDNISVIRSEMEELLEKPTEARGAEVKRLKNENIHLRVELEEVREKLSNIDKAIEKRLNIDYSKE
jgi:hypothetical protein